ncbi:hypothetical protein HPB47_023763 [Ixodes persulcatus]|uniref:Uncharacterized protein n=1 Tax=Ixodes persulcatus TaxID=34615 RepID=A0AC60Q928_IXOPE|nr:hypothetical protein HPB47_023763 [Ixodes persulcatus]
MKGCKTFLKKSKEVIHSQQEFCRPLLADEGSSVFFRIRSRKNSKLCSFSTSSGERTQFGMNAGHLLEKADSYELCSGALKASDYNASFLTSGLKKKMTRNGRLISRMTATKEDVQKMRTHSASVKEDVLSEYISKLPTKQQESVRQCFSAAKVKKKGFHYSKAWILECIIMKMKSPRLYNHIRDSEILALPSKSTLKRYMAVYRSEFRFSHKTLNMNDFKKHGGLLVDELKLSQHLRVKQSGHIEGFVDLGKYTSTTDKSVESDHGMVIMFVPFVGKWSQIIGTFATNGKMKGEILAKVNMQPIREAHKIDSSSLTLKAIPGLTKCHLQPNAFEKMRVGYAFQFFGTRALQGLHLYKEDKRHAGGAAGFVSESTSVGLRVTLHSTLELLSYLVDQRPVSPLPPSRPLYPRHPLPLHRQRFGGHLSNDDAVAMEPHDASQPMGI